MTAKTIHSLLYALFFLFLLNSCDTAQSAIGDRPATREARPMGKNGECYAKVLMPDIKTIESEKCPVYTGSETNNKHVKTIDVELVPASTKWVKKKSDRNCGSPDPNDCLVWCLVEIPRESKSLTIVTDTTQVKAYTWENVSKTKIEKEGGHTEWREVLCQGQITGLVIADISMKLKGAGFYEGEITSENTTTLKVALSQYQKEKSLPVGSLDLETLSSLGVQY